MGFSAPTGGHGTAITPMQLASPLRREPSDSHLNEIAGPKVEKQGDSVP